MPRIQHNDFQFLGRRQRLNFALGVVRDLINRTRGINHFHTLRFLPRDGIVTTFDALKEFTIRLLKPITLLRTA